MKTFLFSSAVTVGWTLIIGGVVYCVCVILSGCCYTTSHTQVAFMYHFETRPDGTMIADVSDAVPMLGGEAGACALGSPTAMAAIGLSGAVKEGLRVFTAPAENLTTTTKGQ